MRPKRPTRSRHLQQLQHSSSLDPPIGTCNFDLIFSVIFTLCLWTALATAIILSYDHPNDKINYIILSLSSFLLSWLCYTVLYYIEMQAVQGYNYLKVPSRFIRWYWISQCILCFKNAESVLLSKYVNNNVHKDLPFYLQLLATLPFIILLFRAVRCKAKSKIKPKDEIYYKFESSDMDFSVSYVPVWNNRGLNIAEETKASMEDLQGNTDTISRISPRHITAVNITEPNKQIKDSMKLFYDERKKIKKNNQNIDLPLHLFSAEDICNKIKFWVYNDSKYEKQLLQTMEIFCKMQLSGVYICKLHGTSNARELVKNECIKFMSTKTFKIMFDCFDLWMNERLDNNEYDILNELQSEAYTAWIVYRHPLQRLLNEIKDKNIDGNQFIDSHAKHQNFIAELTGWEKSDVNQLQGVLFRHNTYSQKQFKIVLNSILEQSSLQKWVIDQIRDNILQYSNLESLQLQMKNAQQVADFSDLIINLVDDLVQQNEDKKQHNTAEAYLRNDFVKQIYESIAKCFIFNNIETLKGDMKAAKEWCCCNCNNLNFCKWINNKLMEDTSVCSLCGISQLDSIIFNIRRTDTFTMVNDIDDSVFNDMLHMHETKTNDEIQNLIHSVCKRQKFKLLCPNQNNNDRCQSFERLATHLILYKKWINTVYKDTNTNNVETIQVNPAEIIDDASYKNIFMNCVRNIKIITNDDIKSFETMFNTKTDDIQNIETFVNLDLSDFKKILKNNTNIKASCVKQIHKKVKRMLHKIATERKFGAFLTDLQMQNIQRDYYHIIQIHIDNGNDRTIENAFKFFETVVHYDDNKEQIKECKSCKRTAKRISKTNKRNFSFIDREDRKTEPYASNASDNKRIWSLKQYYNENQLDTIHSYLVHSNYKYFITRNKKQQDIRQTDSKSEEPQSTNEYMLNIQHNGTRYVTNSYNSYRFGVDYSYPNLMYKYPSIHTELLRNSLQPLTQQNFEEGLTKAIKRLKIIFDGHYKNELKCKYFDRKYNIYRNEMIGIRHVFAIIMYTDISKFCTVFRETYRLINNEKTEKQAQKRHVQFYHYARSIFEAVEFFGQSMSAKLKVHHGLDKVMYFDKFIAYFHQPISTTSSLKKARDFTEGSGIVLTLMSETEYSKDQTKIPKYLSVSFLSDFPLEDEKLFYGAFVAFKIYNITESNLKSHSDELLMFNKFQQTIQNQYVCWDDDEEMLDALVELIEREKQLQTDELKENETIAESNDKYISKYGMELFHYFCANENTTDVRISNVEKLHSKLYKALFDDNTSQTKMSFISITKLFPCLREISLNNLNIDNFNFEAKHYIKDVIQFIKARKDTKLHTINFQSDPQDHRKASATLKESKQENQRVFKKLKWKIEYKHSSSNTHILTFVNSMRKHSDVDEIEYKVAKKYEDNENDQEDNNIIYDDYFPCL